MKLRFITILALLFSGCANSQKDKSYPMDAQVLSHIALTVDDTNKKASINQDFTEAADKYLSEVDKILFRMDQRLNRLEDGVAAVGKMLLPSFKKFLRED